MRLFFVYFLSNALSDFGLRFNFFCRPEEATPFCTSLLLAVSLVTVHLGEGEGASSSGPILLLNINGYFVIFCFNKCIGLLDLTLADVHISR